MNKLHLNNLNLKTFTEQDVLDYCLLNNINTNDIIMLNLNDNELTDISGIKLFKNLEELYLNYNKLKNISVLKDLISLKELYISSNNIKNISVINSLVNLKELSINELELDSNQIKYINSCKNLEELNCYNGFKDMDITDKLNENIEINDYLIYK